MEDYYPEKMHHSGQPDPIVSRYRLMVLINFVRDIPEESTGNFSVEYSAFGQKIKTKVDFQEAKTLSKGGLLVPINKMRIFYFFANSRKGVSEYLNAQKYLKLSLLKDGKVIGVVELELADFLSDKVLKRDYFKFFSGKEIWPILSWGINVESFINSDRVGNLRIRIRKLRKS